MNSSACASPPALASDARRRSADGMSREWMVDNTKWPSTAMRSSSAALCASRTSPIISMERSRAGKERKAVVMASA